MAVCPNCGAPNNGSSKFCTSCGGPLPVPEAVQIPNPQQQYWQQPSEEQQRQSVPVEPAQSIPIVPAQPVYATPITQPVQNRANRPKSNGFCNAGLALSIIGWCTMGITAPLGLLFSFIGLISANKKNEPGRGKAIAGLILSGVLIFGLAISLPTIWADVQDAIDNGQVNNPYELFNAIDDANDRQTNVNDKYVKTIINNGWVAMEDGSYLEFGKKKSFKYYKDYNDTSDNYFTGKYRIYSGSDAIEQLTKHYSQYGVTRKEIKTLIQNDPNFKEENFVLVVLENDGMWQDGKNVKDEEWDTPYYGFLVTSPNKSLLLINMNTATTFSFITDNDYERINN